MQTTPDSNKNNNPDLGDLRPCPKCGSDMYWDGEVWECLDCDYFEEE
jgi:hypothetical protein